MQTNSLIILKLSLLMFMLCTETLSEGVKILKIDYLVKAVLEHKMDRAIIFCRTKIDCDNAERYFQHLGGGELYFHL